MNDRKKALEAERAAKKDLVFEHAPELAGKLEDEYQFLKR